MKLRPRVLAIGCVASLLALPLCAAPISGKISGQVVDSSGIPQMGATVLISPEQLSRSTALQMHTNARGRFSTAIPSGTYSVKVTLAGFLPTMEEHVQVTGREVTVLEVVLGSVFNSVEQLRRSPAQQPAPDDWTWVLRTAAASRSVLQWQDDPPSPANGGKQEESSDSQPSHAEVQFRSGPDHAGSYADFADSPSTQFVYDLGVGPAARLLMAGEINYSELLPMGALAAEWLPSGKPGTGPSTTFVVRESRLSPTAPIFRGLYLSHDDQLALGERVSLRYGGEYVAAGFAGSTSALRPRAQLAIHLSHTWQASAMVAERPWEDQPSSAGEMASTLEALDTFPTLMMRGNRPVLQNDLHEEIALRRDLGNDASITAAVFHDRTNHTAVIGRSASSAPEFLQGDLSQPFAYDGGISSSNGVRVAVKEKLNKDLSTSLIYAYAGALVPDGSLDARYLRDGLDTRYRHSLSGRVSTRIASTNTSMTMAYKWLSGPTVSQQDLFAEEAYHIDPYLSIEIRQPLPRIFPCHMEVGADVGNLLAQGYVPVTTSHGNITVVPAYRYVRGGLSLEF